MDKELFTYLKRYKYEDLWEMNPRPGFISTDPFKANDQLVFICFITNWDLYGRVPDSHEITAALHLGYIRMISPMIGGINVPYPRLTFKGLWFVWNCHRVLRDFNKNGYGL